MKSQKSVRQPQIPDETTLISRRISRIGFLTVQKTMQNAAWVCEIDLCHLNPCWDPFGGASRDSLSQRISLTMRNVGEMSRIDRCRSRNTPQQNYQPSGPFPWPDINFEANRPNGAETFTFYVSKDLFFAELLIDEIILAFVLTILGPFFLRSDAGSLNGQPKPIK